MQYSHTIKLVRFNQYVDGLKTGYTDEAGYCLTATASKNDVRLIAVVMKEADSTTRNSEITSMLDYGFAKIKTVNVAKKDQVIGKIEVDKSKNTHVEIVPIEDVTVVKQKTEKIGKITYELELDNIKAPVKTGDVVGKLIVKEDNKKIKEVNVTVNKNVEKASFIELYFRHLTDMLKGELKI